MTKQNLIRSFFVILLLTPGVSAAQSSTAPVEPDRWSRFVEIGPVEGLTTEWHPAPVETGVPIGATLRFRVPVRMGEGAAWQGAREVGVVGFRAVAELPVDFSGDRTVRVSFTGPGGERLEESIRLTAVDTVLRPVALTPLRASVDEVIIDPRRVNTSTLGYYFRDESIARLTEVDIGRYRTSVNRWVTLRSDVEPAALAPLVEWCLDGEVQRHLGSAVRLRVFTAREHTLVAGPPGASEELVLETYRVRITSHRRGDTVLDGLPVTFEAVTIPPGHEGEISWLASTQHGSASPTLGEGPEFRVQYLDTVAPPPALPVQWLGVRADNAAFGQDRRFSAEDPFACDPEQPGVCGEFGTCRLDAVGGTFCECRAGHAGRRCQVDLRPLRIRINAPPEDFDLVRLPEPAETGQRSYLLELPIEMSDGDGECRWEATIPVDGPGTFSLGLATEPTPPGWVLRMFDDSEREAIPVEEEPEGTPDPRDASFDAPAPGTWRAVVSTGRPRCGPEDRIEAILTLSFEEQGRRGLFSHVSTVELTTGREVGLVSYLFDGEANPPPEGEEDDVPPDPVVGEVVEMSVDVVFPDGAQVTLPMLDDGRHQDGVAGDGRFGAAVETEVEGEYLFVVRATGADADGNALRRTDTVNVPVVTPRARFAIDREIFPDVREPLAEGLPILFPIEPLGVEGSDELRRAQEEEYLISGEIWAELGDGSSPEVPIGAAPVAWISLLATPEAIFDAGDGVASRGHYLSVELDGRWISNLKAVLTNPKTNGLELVGLIARNLRLQDEETAIPVDRIEEIRVRLGTVGLDWVADLPAQFSDPESSPGMLDGDPPPFIEDILRAPTFPGSGQLLLVHGLCGGTGTWPPDEFPASRGRLVRFVGSFSGGAGGPGAEEVSPQTFADEIAAFMNAQGNVAGIVAHSQGGIASLYMFARTWSSLKALEGGENRLIQSVGTPYHGTPLASGGPVRASLRAILRAAGVLCPRREFASLSPLRANLLLATIPSKPRASVYFRRTTHRTDRLIGRYCHWFLSKVLLPGADDGIIQKSRGRLKGAHDLGTKEPLCHNDDMKYSDQKRDDAITEDLCRGSFLGPLGVCED